MKLKIEDAVLLRESPNDGEKLGKLKPITVPLLLLPKDGDDLVEVDLRPMENEQQDRFFKAFEHYKPGSVPPKDLMLTFRDCVVDPPFTDDFVSGVLNGENRVKDFYLIALSVALISTSTGMPQEQIKENMDRGKVDAINKKK